MGVIRAACIKANDQRDWYQYRNGKPEDTSVRLADVLLVIQNTGAVVAFYGNDRLWICEPDLAANINGRKNGAWKLRTDDLTAQSDECIAFLAELLKA